MKFRTIIALALVMLILQTQTSIAVAQNQTSATNPQREWASLSVIPPGDRVIVERVDRRRIRGRLRGVSDTALGLSRGNDVMDINRQDIRRVYRVLDGSVGRSAVRGAAIGGLGAAVVGSISAEGDYKALAGFGFGVIGAGIGALVGGLRGSRARRVLIYEVR